MASEEPAGIAGPRSRLAVAFGAGIVAGVAVWLLTANVLGPLVGWDTAAVVYMAWSWVLMLRAGHTDTARYAVREDPGRAAVDVILLVASVANLASVGAVIVSSGGHSGIPTQVGAALGASSVILSWGLVHTIFTARYARLYYTGKDGGIDFNDPEPPDYLDFAYLAFTIGMTYQVSDTDLQTKAIRRTALLHGLLSYLFGAIILAATINLLAGLANNAGG
jgi:uncharacterized membrane protein